MRLRRWINSADEASAHALAYPVGEEEYVVPAYATMRVLGEDVGTWKEISRNCQLEGKLTNEESHFGAGTGAFMCSFVP